ncbi:hypothetical protein [Primorskyibacter sp. S87]|uniref:hypothetical protein n=1 Tax=Primorskyibacter sp. S87 TaxID=3415126 RepID=UPI003C7ADEF0
MPSRREPPRVCIYGDSHIGGAGRAHAAGLIDWPVGAEVEFWGADGPRFRQIRWEDGVIRASGEAIETVKRINAKGRDHLRPDDFDLFIFYSARLRVAQFMAPLYEWRCDHGLWPSEAVRLRSAAFFLQCIRSYRIARLVAAAGSSVVILPAPFLTDGVVDLSRKGGFLHEYPRSEQATKDELDTMWETLVTAAREDGVTLIPQPQDTVTKGMLTKYEFACKDAIEKKDAGHKSDRFAALRITEALAHFNQQRTTNPISTDCPSSHAG